MSVSGWQKMRDDVVQEKMERPRPASALPWPPLPIQELAPAPEPVRDIQRQMGCLRKEVEAMQAAVHDLLARLEPVMGPAGPAGGNASEPLPAACTPLGQDMQACEGIAYATRLAVSGALDRLQLP